MKNKYCLLIGITSFFICLLQPANAQEADQRIGNLINQGDWFRLEEEYPKVAGQVQAVAIKALSEVMIGCYFNKPGETIALIDSLLEHHQEDLGFANVSSLVALRGKLQGEIGLYAQSADVLYDFLNKIQAFAKKEDFPSHQKIADYYNTLRNEAAPVVSRPNVDTEIPMTIEKAGRGVLMFVPVQIHGKTYKFIFDTGAGSTFVSKRFADEVGIRVVRDSLFLQGAFATSTGRQGVLDSMMIGDIVFKNAIVAIADPNPAVDTVYQVDAVLGTDFMRLVGQVDLYPQDKKVVFPVKTTPLPDTGRNMWLYDGGLRLKVFSGDERLRFVFDTGNVRADMFYPYNQKHKEWIEKEGHKETISGGGFGGVRTLDVFRLPSIPMRLGNTSFEMENIQVECNIPEIDGFQNEEDGSLGMDFINLFHRVTINLESMYLNVEKDN